MKYEREHGDHFQVPPDPYGKTSEQIYPKESEYVQSVRGVVDYTASAAEYHSRNVYDFLDEVRGTISGNLKFDFGRIVKVIWILNTDPNNLNASLYVNFNDAPAADQNGCIQIKPGEVRAFVIPVRKIQMNVTSGSNSGYRITWGY